MTAEKEIWNNINIEALDWTKGKGLMPAIVQDSRSLRVLMLGYVTRESLEATRNSGLVIFYSRSRKKLWQKGESSGHVLRLKSITQDCDADALLLQVEPEGPVCHQGTRTCFGDSCLPNLSIIADLAEVIRQRHLQPKKGSYTTELLSSGLVRIAQKVGEEGVETALAAVTDKSALPSEAADLLYHLLVLLEANDMDYLAVLDVLNNRAKNKS